MWYSIYIYDCLVRALNMTLRDSVHLESTTTTSTPSTKTSSARRAAVVPISDNRAGPWKVGCCFGAVHRPTCCFDIYTLRISQVIQCPRMRHVVNESWRSWPKHYVGCFVCLRSQGLAGTCVPASCFQHLKVQSVCNLPKSWGGLYGAQRWWKRFVLFGVLSIIHLWKNRVYGLWWEKRIDNVSISACFTSSRSETTSSVMPKGQPMRSQSHSVNREGCLESLACLAMLGEFRWV